jgi:hypothetical protein
MATITDFGISLEVRHVLRGQGIDTTGASPEDVAVAQEVLGEAQALLAPAAVYTILPVHDFRHQRVTLEGGGVFEGPLAARTLAGATEVALAVCTIGPALEERVTALSAAGDFARALALNGAGTSSVGQVLATAIARIRAEASARGLGSGMRAGPGQEGWPIEQQRVLFGLVPAGEIGVRLTESGLMLPFKSVSFAIGFGPDMRPDAVACDFCSKRERCPWRLRTEKDLL